MLHLWKMVVPGAIACSLAGAPVVKGATAETARPPSAVYKVSPLAAVMVQELAPIVPERLLADDARAQPEGAPMRFALPADVAITPQSYGTWEELADGGRLWRLRISSPNATDLNLGFTRYHLPPGATLHVVAESSATVRGPYTARDNRPDGELWTPLLPGSRVVVELYIPPSAAFEPSLELGRIGRGYRDLFRTAASGARQGACNVDVACPVADPWRDEIRSVAMYSVNGSRMCTGTMVMDATPLFRPFFLTAYHCGVTEDNDQTVVTYWNFESPACGGHDQGSLADSLSGATLRARRQDVDLCLLELDHSPPPSYGVYWAGWDRRTDHIPQDSVCIHQPGTQEKAISFNDDPLVIRGNCITASPPDTHWEVDNWEAGTTERGSSGAGLWDSETHLLVGSLTGGMAACGNNEWDCFARFAMAWDGPSPGARLHDWLDPMGTGVEVMPGGSPTPFHRVRRQLRPPDRTQPDEPATWPRQDRH